MRASMLALLASAIVCVALATAIPASAALPLIATDGASATGPTTATVEGNGDAEGQETTLHADYALASDLWCTSEGAEGSPLESPPVSLGSGHAMLSEILVALKGLSPGTEYCAELVAHSDAGTTRGGLRRFTTQVAAPPLVATDGASATGPTTARVEGNADPEGLSTTLHADYALASAPWCKSEGREGAPAETAPTNLGSGFAMFSEIGVKLEGLIPSSEYCAELVAHSAAGTTHGGQRRFKTPAAATTPVPSGGSSGGVQPEAKGESAQPPAGNALPLAPPTTIAAAAASKPKPLTKAQKLAKALKLCTRKPKRQRATCRARAHRKYGATPPKTRR